MRCNLLPGCLLLPIEVSLQAPPHQLLLGHLTPKVAELNEVLAVLSIMRVTSVMVASLHPSMLGVILVFDYVLDNLSVLIDTRGVGMFAEGELTILDRLTVGNES